MRKCVSGKYENVERESHYKVYSKVIRLSHSPCKVNRNKYAKLVLLGFLNQELVLKKWQNIYFRFLNVRAREKLI